MESLLTFVRSKAADGVRVYTEGETVYAHEKHICLSSSVHSKIKADKGISTAARLRLKELEMLFVACICSRGYTVNPDTMPAYAPKEFLIVWDFICASCITLDIVSASILDSVRDGRDVEGYCSVMGMLKEAEIDEDSSYDDLMSSIDPHVGMQKIDPDKLKGPFPSLILLKKSCTVYSQSEMIRRVLGSDF